MTPTRRDTGLARGQQPQAGASTREAFQVLYAPRDQWLHLLAAGWRLPWIVDVDRSGWSVLLERDEPVDLLGERPRSVPEIPKRKRGRQSLTAYRRGLT
jgi:hypothetical protein